MPGSKTLFDARWDVDKYKNNYDSEHWPLCRAFMETHKTKYSEQTLAHLTEAFYQMGVYGSSYDPKTTRIVSAMTVEVLEGVLKSHPGIIFHPFNKSAVVTKLPTIAENTSSKEVKEASQSASIWDVQVDQNIIANVLVEAQLKELFKGFVTIYDIRRTSAMNDNKVSILEESFKRSKFGPCHWAKDDTHNNICPIRMALKWRNIVLAEAVGSDENSLKTRLAQAVLSKMSKFCSGIEAKWSYYRDGRLSDRFDNPNPRKSNIYKVMRRSQFKAMAEIISFVDTFANSDSYAEVVFSMDFSNQEKTQLMEYIDKNWFTKLTYRTLSKHGVKNKSESHVFVYHIRTGEELRRWLEQTDGENERYRIVFPGNHRRAGTTDSNVREVLTTDAVGMPREHGSPPVKETQVVSRPLKTATNDKEEVKKQEVVIKGGVLTKKTEEVDEITVKDTEGEVKNTEEKDKDTEKENNKKDSSKKEEIYQNSDDLEKLLDGFVLFYDANKTSEIDKDDWFTALCESFKVSKFGPLEVVSENVRPLRTRCAFKWKDRTLASAEGLTETQAKTAATLQLISKLEPFTYIIQAKEEYFCGGKVPSFIEDSTQMESEFCRIVRRKDLPSYYTIFQTIDDFSRSQTHGELVFGPDFTWELKNEIVVYLKAKGLSHRYFTQNDQKPWTHMAVYHVVKPEELKDHLLKNGGENEKYKLIPPPKAEPIKEKPSEEKSSKESKKPSTRPLPKKPVAKVVEKRKQLEAESLPVPIEDEVEIETNKIQIKLKKFKVDKVDYPEDTGGDFPGLILWIGIRKNSVWQKNLFSILLESFKMSKFGELNIEESEENVWGRKEPFKKCVIKSSRKVLAVGLGESKTEAKMSASLQVLRQLRKHCYTIQAKESYFKEGKATPYNFNPDPAKAHVYKVVKRNKFKDRGAIIKYVNEFAKDSCSEEIIFGDDFTYDERENILDHCRKIDLNYRLMKCHSITRNMHTHIAIFHQQPLPLIKAELMKTGGENDMYRLIPPGGKITNQNNDADMWPELSEEGKEVASKTAQATNLPVQQSKVSLSSEPHMGKETLPQNLTTEQTSTNSKPIPSLINRVAVSNEKENDNSNLDSPIPYQSPQKKQILKNTLVRSKDQEMNVSTGRTNNETLIGVCEQSPLNQQVEPQLQYGPHHLPQVLIPPVQEVPFGPQPMYIPPPPMYGQPFMDTPLQFGPHPPVYGRPIVTDMGMVPQMDMVNQNMPENLQIPINIVPQANQAHITGPSVTITVANSPKSDLREELAKKRHTENRTDSHDRKVYDMNVERRVINTDKNDNGWSRKVFVAVTEDGVNNEEQNSNSVEFDPQDLREKLRHKDPPKETKGKGEQKFKRNSPQKGFFNRKSGNAASRPKETAQDLREKLRHKDPPKGPGEHKFKRTSPQRNFESRLGSADRGRSPQYDQRRISSERNQSRDVSRERPRFRDLSPQAIISHRESSHERRVFHDSREDYHNRIRSDKFRSRSRSRSPPFPPRRAKRSQSPMVRTRDLWDNIPGQYTQSIFMYKYIKQNSKVETDPYALLRATRSLSFNVDFDFIKQQTAIEEWHVSVELIGDEANIHPLVGEGVARTERDASLRAALHAVDTIQKACRVIEPNYRYFCDGGVPDFILRKNPIKTSIYEIIQNMDPGTPLAPYTVEMMFKMFVSSDLEDLFFLATDFSYNERCLVIEMASHMNLWWRLFGPRHPDARPDDIVSTQHVCVFKQKTALQLVTELMANGGSTEKYTLVDPREYRLTRPRVGREYD